jgi:hypothetical protein
VSQVGFFNDVHRLMGNGSEDFDLDEILGKEAYGPSGAICVWLCTGELDHSA